MKNRFAHNYSATEPEIKQAIEELVVKAQKRRRMLSSRPPVPDDLPEGVAMPQDPHGVVATFLNRKPR